jgi:hypothetical protein
LHRVLKSQPKEPVSVRGRHIQPFIQEFHSAWIFEELHNDPHLGLDHIASGLRTYFNLDVSCSTIWRHIRGGALEAHGFPGFTRPPNDHQQSDGLTV